MASIAETPIEEGDFWRRAGHWRMAHGPEDGVYIIRVRNDQVKYGQVYPDYSQYSSLSKEEFRQRYKFYKRGIHVGDKVRPKTESLTRLGIRPPVPHFTARKLGFRTENLRLIPLFRADNWHKVADYEVIEEYIDDSASEGSSDSEYMPSEDELEKEKEDRYRNNKRKRGNDTPYRDIAMSRQANRQLALLIENYDDDTFKPYWDRPIDWKAVKDLLDKGASPNVKNEKGFTLMHFAAMESDTAHAIMLLEKRANLDATNQKGETPLFIAIRLDQFPEVTKLLLEKGADPNIKNQYGKTPIFLTVRYGDTEVTELLLKKGADPNVTNSMGMTPLHEVSIEDDETYATIVKLLLQYGAKADTPQRMSGITALRIAVQQGMRDGVELLLKAGADPNQTDENGYTPFLAAVSFGDGLLYEPMGFHESVEHETRIEIVRLLIEYKADINTPVPADYLGGTDNDSLFWHLLRSTAITYTESLEMELTFLNIFIDKGADPNQTDEDGWRPLYTFLNTVDDNADRLVSFLLEKGADPNATSQNRETPLFSYFRRYLYPPRGGSGTVEEIKIEIVKKLLEAGADPDKKIASTYYRNSIPTSSIQIADGRISLEVRQLLLQYSKREPVFDCPICQEPLGPRATQIIKLSCGHLFHKNCIQQWAIRSRGQSFSCPQCREEIQPAELDTEGQTFIAVAYKLIGNLKL